MKERQFCSLVSQAADETFIGTAPRVDTWLFIEYPGAWGVKAVEESTLPEQVKSWLHAKQQDIPAFRVQVIRQGQQPRTEITCFVAVTREDRQAIYRFTLSSYDEVPSLDILAISAGDERYNANLTTDPLFLVCTNGRHDMCCAKFGMPVYRELSRYAGEQAWQCNHLGGDKFAANVLCLPHGLLYGRVTDSDVETIVDLCREDTLVLEHFRGRTLYRSYVQAAEFFLRAETGDYRVGTYRVRNVEPTNVEGQYRVDFEAVDQARWYRIMLTEDIREVESYSSCRGHCKTKKYHYCLDAVHVVEASHRAEILALSW